MKVLNIVKMINDAIINHKYMVLNTLRESNVVVSENMSDKQIFDLTNLEVKRGNKLLVDNFGLLLTELYDFSPLVEKENSSNFASSDTNKVVIIGLNDEKKVIELN